MHIETTTPPWPTSFDPAAAQKWTVMAQQIDENSNHRGQGGQPGVRAPGLHVRAAFCRVCAAWDKNCGWERGPGAEKGGRGEIC